MPLVLTVAHAALGDYACSAGPETQSSLLLASATVDALPDPLAAADNSVDDQKTCENDTALSSSAVREGLAQCEVCASNSTSQEMRDNSGNVLGSSQHVESMEGSSTPDGASFPMPAGPAAQQQRLEVAAAAVLVHAAGCKSPTCPVPHCNKMRKIHTHFLECRYGSDLFSTPNMLMAKMPLIVVSLPPICL